MICWSCDDPAKGVCIFCGRAVCQEHVEKKVHIMAMYDEDSDVPHALITKNALYCGRCEPHPKAIPMPELE